MLIGLTQQNTTDRDQINGTIREIQAVGPTSFELVIVGIRDDEQAPTALRERAAALMDTIDRYKELNNTFSIYQIRGGPERLAASPLSENSLPRPRAPPPRKRPRPKRKITNWR